MAMGEMFSRDEPVFIISVAARMLGVRTQTLRYYESLGLVEPTRTRGNQRVYSRRDVERVQHIRDLMDDLGVNLAGVEVILKLLNRLQDAESEISRLKAENESLRDLLNASR
ncbi:MAG: MerR family transcriptional regulator [Chloroflexi bacterium]|nr:MerR family transcriptional regulator [Chloroflexota bacterium]